MTQICHILRFLFKSTDGKKKPALTKTMETDIIHALHMAILGHESHPF